MKRVLASVFAFTSPFLPCDAEAARPMITDDARIVDPKSCQVEAWVRRVEAELPIRDPR